MLATKVALELLVLNMVEEVQKAGSFPSVVNPTQSKRTCPDPSKQGQWLVDQRNLMTFHLRCRDFHPLLVGLCFVTHPLDQSPDSGLADASSANETT